MIGKVMKSTGSWYLVSYDGAIWQCRTRGKLRLEDSTATNPISVVDEVEFEKETGSASNGVITNILPRRNFITRKASRKTQESQVIAANIDIAALMVTLFSPRTSPGFIDRFTVSAESFRIPVFLIFNKIDLHDTKSREEQARLKDMYSLIGFKCFEISAKEGTGLDKLAENLTGKVILLSGHSGVGKSTLLNVWSENIAQRTADISSFSTKGVHTTTFAEMFEVFPQTFIIDTPGIKEFGLIDIEEFELSDYFPEMRAMRGKCKFHNCTHYHEPKCAIKAAVEEGTIFESRYRSYLSMLRNEDTRK
jgi:ribosome biogenesis GTPase